MPPEKRKLNSPALTVIGIVLTAVCTILLTILFYPTIKNEVNYKLHRPNAGSYVALTSSPEDLVRSVPTIVAKDKDFSVVIPKIGANAKVIADVDPKDSRVYQQALTQGVAHAKGTALPDQPGNTFLFAHSSDSILNANTYNAVFYLLNKLEPDDMFYIAYKEKLYNYRVVKKQLVSPTEINYYDKSVADADQTATLMTCWPPATTLKRLVVVGELTD